MDRRRILTLAACVLVAGDVVASTATTTGARQGPVGPARTPAGGTGGLPALIHNARHDNARPAGPASVYPTGNTPRSVPHATGTSAIHFTAPPRISTTEEPPSGEMKDGGVLQLAGWWLSAWYADPCEDFDTAVNGFWKLVNPPHRSIPSRLRELDHELEDRLLHKLGLLAPASVLTPAGRLLAGIWASAFRPQSHSWTAFAPQASAIAALSARRDVAVHLCNGLGEGRDSILEFRSELGIPELDTDAALLPPQEREVYSAPPDDPRVIAHLEHVQALLVSAGMPAGEAGASAPVLLRMESRLAAAADGLTEVDLDSAQRAVPGFPWRETWDALGLDDAQKVYVGLERCRMLDVLLQDHDIADWKAWLLYQEARHARPFIEYHPRPRTVLHTLDHKDLAQHALSEWFMEGSQPGPAQRAHEMFEHVRHQFRQDVASSELPDADKQRIDEALAATQLDVGSHSQGIPSVSQPANATFLQHIQALRRASLQQGVRQLTASVAAGPRVPAHRFFMANGLDYRTVFASPALVASLLEEASGSAELEWAAVGAMLGHELAHTLGDVAQLSAQGAALMVQRKAEIAQRISDIEVAGKRLDIPRVLEEVACDFRGLSAARRAGHAEAQAAGKTFDDRRFFTAAARLHAANPTPAQVREGLAEDDHPPPQVRVALLQQAKGFEAAFDCQPRPSQPFDAVV